MPSINTTKILIHIFFILNDALSPNIIHSHLQIWIFISYFSLKLNFNLARSYSFFHTIIRISFFYKSCNKSTFCVGTKYKERWKNILMSIPFLIFSLCNPFLTSCFVKNKDFIWHFTKNLVEGYERENHLDFCNFHMKEMINKIFKRPNLLKH